MAIGLVCLAGVVWMMRWFSIRGFEEPALEWVFLAAAAVLIGSAVFLNRATVFVGRPALAVAVFVVLLGGVVGWHVSTRYSPRFGDEETWAALSVMATGGAIPLDEISEDEFGASAPVLRNLQMRNDSIVDEYDDIIRELNEAGCDEIGLQGRQEFLGLDRLRALESVQAAKRAIARYEGLVERASNPLGEALEAFRPPPLTRDDLVKKEKSTAHQRRALLWYELYRAETEIVEQIEWGIRRFVDGNDVSQGLSLHEEQRLDEFLDQVNRLISRRNANREKARQVLSGEQVDPAPIRG